MGPGPSNSPPAVLAALSAPVLGHLDPEFLSMMDGTQEMLRDVFRTANRLTIPVSGTGSAGMECCVVNIVEPGDVAVVGVNGVFGARMCEVAARAGASVIRIDFPWGEPVDISALIDAHREHPLARFVGVVHAETSTGALSPLEELGAYLRGTETLLLVDTVTSLAGLPVEVDAWHIDLCYSGSQKCLSVPPGLSPVTVSEKAEAVMDARTVPVQSWYLDLQMIRRYWGEERTYHHTAPTSMVAALHAGLAIVLDEGLEARWARHAEAGQLLRDGLEERGFLLFARQGFRLPMLTTAIFPSRYTDADRRRLLDGFSIEIGAGLGELAGKGWRIGLMGHSATPRNVSLVLSALDALAA
jgi:alanine-glyoxylate transaminase / serine-glyoxylate transaminase / serine-pyruvate transaminase